MGTARAGAGPPPLARAGGSCYKPPMQVIHLYRSPALGPSARAALLATARARGSEAIVGIDTELCFNVELAAPLTEDARSSLAWLLAETFEPELFGSSSRLDPSAGEIFEVGPRLNFTTAWSTNAVSVCRACSLDRVLRIEPSRRYLVRTDRALDPTERAAWLALIHDRMTECPYPVPLSSFDAGMTPAPVRRVPVLAEGRAALKRLDRELGLAFDSWDLEYYTALFRDRLRRDPTDVECFDVAQSNSEHSRHWFFKGRLVLDGVEAPQLAARRRPRAIPGAAGRQRDRLP